MQVLDGTPIVLKPCFSRFAVFTVILPQGKQDPRIENVKKSLESGVEWVAQQYIAGRQLCTFRLKFYCHEFTMTA